MAAHILRCSEHGYTMEKECQKCNLSTKSPRPAKFSLEDKYGDYRRNYKKEKGLY